MGGGGEQWLAATMVIITLIYKFVDVFKMCNTLIVTSLRENIKDQQGGGGCRLVIFNYFNQQPHSAYVCPLQQPFTFDYTSHLHTSSPQVSSLMN